MFITWDDIKKLNELPWYRKPEYRPCDKCKKRVAWCYEGVFYKGKYLCFECLKPAINEE